MKKPVTLIVLLICAFALIPSFRVWAYPVPPLPNNNLITNSWFRSATNPNEAGLDGWTNVLNDGVGWGISQKVSNPSPEILFAGVCDFQPVFCGTGARWAHERDEGEIETYPGVNVYLYQVVATNPGHRRLNFSMYWVNHRLEVGEVLIYGANNVNGPWNLVWLPITISQDVNPPPCCVPGHNGLPWFKTAILDTTLAGGYPFYKIVLHARYPDTTVLQGDVGVKITGVYFTSQATTDQTSLSTPVVVYNPTMLPDDVTAQPTATQSGRATQIGATPTATNPGSTPTSQAPTPTPTPGSDGEVHVTDLDADSALSGVGKWDAFVTITVRVQEGHPVAGATVFGSWSNGANGSGNCTTDAAGKCTVEKKKIKTNIGDVTFHVDEITYPGAVYNPAQNSDPDGDSNGTEIIIFAP